MPSGAEVALPVRRSRLVDFGAAEAVVVEIDATEHPTALAVLQASLHELPEGTQLGYGYDVSAAGLGAWVGDQKVRLTVRPVLASADGEISGDDPSAPGADVLRIDFDPKADAAALDDLRRVGRLLIAGPEMGPIPLVLTIAADALGPVVDELGA